MKKFALILVLFVVLVWSEPMEFGSETGSQDPNAGKNAAVVSKSPELQKKTGKEAAVQPQAKKKKSAKKDEDCGCDTTLFGEPVPQPVKKSVQGKANTAAGKQSAKSKGKNFENSKTAIKSDLKEGPLENTGKQPASSGNAGQSKNLTAQSTDK
jgi:hypothetical protein